MESKATVSLPPDAPERFPVDDGVSSNPQRQLPVPFSTPALPFGFPGPLFVPLPSSQYQTKRDQQTYFNVPDQLSPHRTQNLGIPPSATQLSDMNQRPSDITRSVTDQPRQHIPRPPNAFMLFRSWLLKNDRVPPNVERRQQNLSKVAGRCWNMMGEEDKNKWRARAAGVAYDHQKKYPLYKFTPAPKGTGRGGKHKRTSELGSESVDEDARIQLLVEICCPELKGRVPTPTRRRPKAKRQEFEDNVDFKTGLSHSFSPLYSTPSPSYSTPSPAYSAPSPAYSMPSTAYPTPSPVYSTPSPAYFTPSPAYSMPSPAYSTPSPASSMSSPASYASSPATFIPSSPASSTAPSPSSANEVLLYPTSADFQFAYFYRDMAHIVASPSATAGEPSISTPVDGFELTYAPSSFENDVTPMAANFQFSYEPAAVQPPPPDNYTFGAPAFSFPSGAYPDANVHLGLHDLQLPYANVYPYRHISATPLTSSEEAFQIDQNFMQSLSFDHLVFSDTNEKYVSGDIGGSGSLDGHSEQDNLTSSVV